MTGLSDRNTRPSYAHAYRSGEQLDGPGSSMSLSTSTNIGSTNSSWPLDCQARPPNGLRPMLIPSAPESPEPPEATKASPSRHPPLLPKGLMVEPKAPEELQVNTASSGSPGAPYRRREDTGQSTSGSMPHRRREELSQAVVSQPKASQGTRADGIEVFSQPLEAPSQSAHETLSDQHGEAFSQHRYETISDQSLEVLAAHQSTQESIPEWRPDLSTQQTPKPNPSDSWSIPVHVEKVPTRQPSVVKMAPAEGPKMVVEKWVPTNPGLSESTLRYRVLTTLGDSAGPPVDHTQLAESHLWSGISTTSAMAKPGPHASPTTSRRSLRVQSPPVPAFMSAARVQSPQVPAQWALLPPPSRHPESPGTAMIRNTSSPTRVKPPPPMPTQRLALQHTGPPRGLPVAPLPASPWHGAQGFYGPIAFGPF
eukprot:gnl/TRDRNA2_/TRDRNA2_136427_c0_seq1.p1 gnl/TRDRNA2_/TRDRNA2_136427_c0~~gnl/TRDRNA2_/TRDRNA2_136427_c0_seq1.p1  ORF type:complete len:424 (-),score=32.10 gnl/TRDRNA2_/TRDRNA2_136427_c0_seq1:113-1384(-)